MTFYILHFMKNHLNLIYKISNWQKNYKLIILITLIVPVLDNLYLFNSDKMKLLKKLN